MLRILGLILLYVVLLFGCNTEAPNKKPNAIAFSEAPIIPLPPIKPIKNKTCLKNYFTASESTQIAKPTIIANITRAEQKKVTFQVARTENDTWYTISSPAIKYYNEMNESDDRSYFRLDLSQVESIWNNNYTECTSSFKIRAYNKNNTQHRIELEPYDKTFQYILQPSENWSNSLKGLAWKPGGNTDDPFYILIALLGFTIQKL